MKRQLRPVGLDFARSAPLRLVFVTETAAAPEAVFAALADTESWPRWYREVTMARPVGERGREIHLRGGYRFAETVLAAEPRERYAYRVERTNAPGLRALLEEWRLAPAGAEPDPVAGDGVAAAAVEATATVEAGARAAEGGPGAVRDAAYLAAAGGQRDATGAAVAAGTRVRYTVALDGTPPALALVRLLTPALRRAFLVGVRALDRQLSAAP